jgi:hypothetical protein
VLIGPDYAPQGPALGPILTTQTIRSAFELPWEEATIAPGHQTLTGRSWSGGGAIERVEVSVDRGPYRPATLIDQYSAGAWARWELEWDAVPGSHVLRARATDGAGNTQPDAVPFNEQGYLYGGVVPHVVNVG